MKKSLGFIFGSTLIMLWFYGEYQKNNKYKGMEPMDKISKIFIHHSDSTDGKGNDWAAIRRFHMSYRYKYSICTKAFYDSMMQVDPENCEPPWRDIGYHAGCELFGSGYSLRIGRPEDIPGSHTKGWNTRSLGFCFVGDYDSKMPDLVMVQFAVDNWLGEKCIKYDLDPFKDVLPHSDYSDKTCPGKLFNMQDLRQRLKIYIEEHK